MQTARKNRRIAHAAFEALESRQLMSVTVAPTGGNDTAAIQNAINSTPAGQTVNLGAGTYHVSATLNIDGHTIAGAAGQTVLDWTGASQQYFVNTGSNSELQGLTLNGACINVSDSAANVTITNDTITNSGNGDDGYYNGGIVCQGGCNNLQITHNTLENVAGYGMILYSINQSHIDYNTITNIYEGIHAVNFGGYAAGNDCTVNYNTVTGITRHGIEIQNNWTNLSVGWNYVADFNVQSGGNSHFALSIATGPGTGGAIAENVDVHDNVLLGTGPGIPSDPNYCFTAVEIMGDGSIVNHNYMANWGWGVLDGMDANWQVTNNYYVHVSNSGDSVQEYQGVPPSVDSGNTWVSSWDGTVPSAFADAGANGTGSSGSTGSPAPVTAAVAAPTNLTATSPNSSEIDLNWADQTSGQATYTIEMKSTYGVDPYVTVATLPAGTTSYDITGLNANWWYNITVTATVNGQNSSAASGQDEVLPPPSVSSPPIVVSSGAGASGSSTSSGTTTTTTSSPGSKSKTGSTSSTGSKSTASSASSTSTGSTPSTPVAKNKTGTKKSRKTVSTPPIAVAAAPGHGLSATFYKGIGMKKAVATEVTANVDYRFNGTSKTVPALTSPAGKNNFSVAWTGELEAPTTGKYRITAKADDGVRVWIDGREVVNSRSNASNTGKIKLAAGEKYDIKVQYFHKTGKATAQLLWATKGTAREAIPDEDLYLPKAA